VYSHNPLDTAAVRVCITLYGVAHCQDQGSPALLLSGRKRRVDGKPRIVHQTYLGTAEKVAALVQDRAARCRLRPPAGKSGCRALVVAAQESGVFALLQALWPAPRSGPSSGPLSPLGRSPAHLRAGPKTDVAAWYTRRSAALWRLPAERFTSQAFWIVSTRSASGRSRLTR